MGLDIKPASPSTSNMKASNMASKALILIVLFAFFQASWTKDSEEVQCDSEVCSRTGAQLHQAINFSVDPCDDFFEFACGGWDALHPIPDDQNSFDISQILVKTMRQNVQAELAKMIKEKQPHPSKIVQYSVDVYAECLDRAQIERQGLAPLVDLIDSVLQDWPIIEPEDVLYRFSAAQQDLAEFMVKTTLTPFFDLAVLPDEKNTSANLIHIGTPRFSFEELGVTKHHRFKVQEVDDAYMQLIVNVLTFLGPDDADVISIAERAEEINNFENSLAELISDENERDAESQYNRMTFAELTTLSDNQYDWTRFANRLFQLTGNGKTQLKPSDVVIVQDPEYFKQVMQVLNEAPKYVIDNYLGWQIASAYGLYVNEELFDIFFEFDKLVNGVKEKRPMDVRCYGQAYDYFDWALSRVYVDSDRNHSMSTKYQAELVVNEVQASFHQLLITNDWLDGITRTKALEKLSKIIKNVAYPDWILDDAQLDDFYAVTNQTVVKGKYLESLLVMGQLMMVDRFAQLSKPVDPRSSWAMPPAIVNAAYEPTQNSITIPLGILVPPFFDPDLPANLNYGGIGIVIGHEMTHGFDDEGAKFWWNGNLENWWTNETLGNFRNRTECFIKQYSNVFDPIANLTLDGSQEVGENIADNGGVNEAFSAFRDYVKQNESSALKLKLPHLDTFSAAQLFFLNYAQTWCGNQRRESLVNEIKGDPHAPGKYRVIVPLQNSPQFAKAYKCSSQSRMTLADKDRCTIW